MFKNAKILYEIKISKRRRYYAKFQDLTLKRRREIFYEMDPRTDTTATIIHIFIANVYNGSQPVLQRLPS